MLRLHFVELLLYESSFLTAKGSKEERECKGQFVQREAQFV